jgi:hypothetical protein
MTVNIKTQNHQQHPINTFPTIKEDDVLNTSQSSSSIQISKTDEVTISQEAKDKQLEEVNAAALQKILNTEENKEGVEESPLDQMIEELKEQIAELTQEIAKLNGNDESSQEKAKILNAELAVLNAQLIELMSQQLES